MVEAYPLHWPIGWERHDNTIRSRFGDWNSKPTVAKARNKLLNEIRLLGGTDLIISTNLQLRQDGFPRSNQKEPDDPGVSLWFNRNGEQVSIACDTYDKVGCNLWALALTIEKIRGIERWGCSEFLNRAFTGFKALPENGSVAEILPWWAILEVDQNASFEVITASWKAFIKKYHPDNPETGDESKFKVVQEAYKQAKEAHNQ